MERTMNHKKMLVAIVGGLLVGLMTVNTGFSQTKPEQPAVNVQRKIPKVSMKAKIVHDKVSKGYQVIRTKPHEEYKVLNVKEDILKEFADKGELVAIDGSLPRGAYFLVIEKINGKDYPQ
jgi:hypothetical protein